jgi:hypothetical protein
MLGAAERVTPNMMTVAAIMAGLIPILDRFVLKLCGADDRRQTFPTVQKQRTD